MKRRQFITASAAAPAIALASTEQPKTARYAIVISKSYDRGAVVAFSLVEAVTKAKTDLGRDRQFDSGHIGIEVCYVDPSRGTLYIDDTEITHSALTEDAARSEIVKNWNSHLAYAKSERPSYHLGPPPDPSDIAFWERITTEGPTDQEIEQYRSRYKRVWFSDAELAEYERNHIA